MIKTNFKVILIILILISSFAINNKLINSTDNNSINEENNRKIYSCDLNHILEINNIDTINNLNELLNNKNKLEISNNDNQLLKSSQEQEQEDTDKYIIYNIPLEYEYQVFLQEACEYYNFDYSLIMRMMYVESSYNKYACSYMNCIGLLQVDPRYSDTYIFYNDDYDKYIINDLYDVKTNIILSLRELSFWRNECESRGLYNDEDYLNCYNRGYLYFKDHNKFYSDKIFSKSIQDIENSYN